MTSGACPECGEPFEAIGFSENRVVWECPAGCIIARGMTRSEWLGHEKEESGHAPYCGYGRVIVSATTGRSEDVPCACARKAALRGEA